MTGVNNGVPEQCDACGIKLCGMIITQCGHLACPECFIGSVDGGINGLKDAAGISCPHCRMQQDVEIFAYMQPGFSVTMVNQDGYNLGVDEWWNVENNPAAHAKGMHIIQQINTFEAAKKPFKAVIFSQFKTALYTIGDKLVRRAIQKHDPKAKLGEKDLMSPKRRKSKKFALDSTSNSKGYLSVADYQYPEQAVRDAELHRFQNDPDCNVLLLGEDATDGLDLSFVTVIFVVDEVWDHAKWTQLVARANRIGAIQSVSVRRLVARGTLEETMAEMNLNARSETGVRFTPKERVYQLLQHVKLVRTGKETVKPPGELTVVRASELAAGAADDSESDVSEADDFDAGSTSSSDDNSAFNTPFNNTNHRRESGAANDAAAAAIARAPLSSTVEEDAESVPGLLAEAERVRQVRFALPVPKSEAGSGAGPAHTATNRKEEKKTMPVLLIKKHCNGCGQDDQNFSKRQNKKGSDGRCVDCIQRQNVAVSAAFVEKNKKKKEHDKDGKKKAASDDTLKNVTPAAKRPKLVEPAGSGAGAGAGAGAAVTSVPLPTPAVVAGAGAGAPAGAPTAVEQLRELVTTVTAEPPHQPIIVAAKPGVAVATVTLAAVVAAPPPSQHQVVAASAPAVVAAPKSLVDRARDIADHFGLTGEAAVPCKVVRTANLFFGLNATGSILVQIAAIEAAIESN